MKRVLFSLVLAFGLSGALAAPASAACVAEYKASRGSPPKFSYGTIVLPEGVCTVPEAMVVVRAQLNREARDWNRVQIVSIQRQ